MDKTAVTSVRRCMSGNLAGKLSFVAQATKVAAICRYNGRRGKPCSFGLVVGVESTASERLMCGALSILLVYTW